MVRLVLLAITALVLIWIHIFYFTVFVFCFPSAYLSTLFLLGFIVTNTIVPVSSCHLSHAGKWSKLLNCSAALSRTCPLPHKRLLLFAFLIYCLSREDKKGHVVPHSAVKWSMKMVREGHWREPTLLHAPVPSLPAYDLSLVCIHCCTQMLLYKHRYWRIN